MGRRDAEEKLYAAMLVSLVAYQGLRVPEEVLAALEVKHVRAKTLLVEVAKVVAAILDAETGELRFQRLGGEAGPVVKLCRSLAAPVRVRYEAGPTGYELARALGVERVVARRARSRAGRPRRSGPTVATPSTWCGCCSRAACIRSGCRYRRRRRCAIWCAPARTSAAS
jgi:hypothetical protein